jgi:hypothetical protein
MQVGETYELFELTGNEAVCSYQYCIVPCHDAAVLYFKRLTPK